MPRAATRPAPVSVPAILAESWVVRCMLIAPLRVVADIAPAADAFKYYADPLLYLFVGGFFIAHAMTRHGLDLRIAGGIVRARWVQGSAARVRLGFVCAAVVLSMWVSNTASAAILVPILLVTPGMPELQR